MKASTDLTGQTIGRFFIVEAAERDSQGRRLWQCRCLHCGTIRIMRAEVVIRADADRPCRCRHGMSSTSLYRRWETMRQRCGNPRSHQYAFYGRRGIRVCKRWNDFLAFFADVGPPPTAAHTIDRIHSAGHYSCGKCAECVARGWPSNVRWATWHTQSRNKRTTHFITCQGETLCVTDWSLRLGIDRKTLRERLARGWDLAAAVRAAPLN